MLARLRLVANRRDLENKVCGLLKTFGGDGVQANNDPKLAFCPDQFQAGRSIS